jgi:hypothetical protein
LISAGSRIRTSAAGSPPEGKHEIAFQAESNKGAIRDLGAIPVIVTH